ncbi:MAG TPA: PKD domain-containing protein [Thermoplasmata archaeon]|nr:PKD domain-containing protein [Thermoplasmata archaeon]
MRLGGIVLVIALLIVMLPAPGGKVSADRSITLARAPPNFGAFAVSAARASTPLAAHESAAPANDSRPTWTPGTDLGPPPRIDAAYASDPATGLSIVFGGYQNTTPPCPIASSCVSGDTWTLSDGTWTDVTPAVITSTNSPSARFGAAMVYDAALAGFVLFGGASALSNGFNNPALGDTWLFTPGNSSWRALCGACVANSTAPTPRWDSGVAYDPASGALVVFAGLSTNAGTTQDLSDTWTFNGTAWNLSTAGPTPAARSAPSMAWDVQTSSILLFGGIPADASTARTWSFDGARWSLLNPTTSPPAMGGSGAVTDPVNGSVLVIGGCATDPCTSGSINETWTYSRGDWYRLIPSLRPGPEGRDHEALFDIGPRHAVGLFGGDAAGQPSNDTWYLYHIEVDPAWATPSTVDIGQTVALRVNVTGGLGYDAYRWVGLPAGCVSANLSAITCSPTGPGPYSSNIRAVVTDQLGQSVYSPPAAVTFNADPSVSVSASPLSGIEPLQASFFATTSGGTGPIGYEWSFGDFGTGRGPNPSHTYLRAGTFTATVWANDSLGLSSHTAVVLSVVALLGLNLAISPVSFDAGNSSIIAATGFGGLPPYTYGFSGLPVGCVATSANQSTCTVSTPGTYRFVATVSDHSGQSSRANGTLVVSARPAAAGGSSANVYWYVLAGGVAAGVVLGLTALFVLRRRRRPPTPRQVTTVPLPEPHELPRPGGSLYVPPPGHVAKRKP